MWDAAEFKASFKRNSVEATFSLCYNRRRIGRGRNPLLDWCFIIIKIIKIGTGRSGERNRA